MLLEVGRCVHIQVRARRDKKVRGGCVNERVKEREGVRVASRETSPWWPKLLLRNSRYGSVTAEQSGDGKRNCEIKEGPPWTRWLEARAGVPVVLRRHLLQLLLRPGCHLMLDSMPCTPLYHNLSPQCRTLIGETFFSLTKSALF